MRASAIRQILRFFFGEKDWSPILTLFNVADPLRNDIYRYIYIYIHILDFYKDKGKMDNCNGNKSLNGYPTSMYRKCAEEGCTILPHFNYEGERALYCARHKRNGMIDVKTRRCDGCQRRH